MDRMEHDIALVKVDKVLAQFPIIDGRNLNQFREALAQLLIRISRNFFENGEELGFERAEDELAERELLKQ